MKKTTLLMTTICAAATGLIPLSPALANAPTALSGYVDVGYGNYSFPGSTSINAWGGSGALAFGFGASDLGAQLNGNYENWSVSGSSGSVSNWGIGGSLFWAPGDAGRIGATVAYNSLSGSGSDISGNFNTTSYGGFGEWYASNMFTLAVKTGGFSATVGGSGCEGGSCNRSGWYIGGGATGYLMPDLALSGSVDYLSVTGGSQTTYGIGLEWLVSEAVPISISGGYGYNTLSGGGSLNSSEWLFAVKFYFNGDSSMSLRDRQRNGASTWAVQPPKLIGG